MRTFFSCTHDISLTTWAKHSSHKPLLPVIQEASAAAELAHPSGFPRFLSRRRCNRWRSRSCTLLHWRRGWYWAHRVPRQTEILSAFATAQNFSTDLSYGFESTASGSFKVLGAAVGDAVGDQTWCESLPSTACPSQGASVCPESIRRRPRSFLLPPWLAKILCSRRTSDSQALSRRKSSPRAGPRPRLPTLRRLETCQSGNSCGRHRCVLRSSTCVHRQPGEHPGWAQLCVADSTCHRNISAKQESRRCQTVHISDSVDRHRRIRAIASHTTTSYVMSLAGLRKRTIQSENEKPGLLQVRLDEEGEPAWQRCGSNVHPGTRKLGIFALRCNPQSHYMSEGTCNVCATTTLTHGRGRVVHSVDANVLAQRAELQQRVCLFFPTAHNLGRIDGSAASTKKAQRTLSTSI